MSEAMPKQEFYNKKMLVWAGVTPAPKPAPPEHYYRQAPPPHDKQISVAEFAEIFLTAPCTGYAQYTSLGQTRYAQIQSIVYNERSEQYAVKMRGKKTITMQRYLSPDAPVLVA